MTLRNLLEKLSPSQKTFVTTIMDEDNVPPANASYIDVPNTYFKNFGTSVLNAKVLRTDTILDNVIRVVIRVKAIR